MRVLSLVLVIGLAGCASSQKLPCGTTDWYELGRQQGAVGADKAPPRTIASSCKSEDQNLDAQALYESGHSLGLAEYCSEKNGYQLAQMNQDYKKGTCPDLLEEAFLRGYKNGQESIRLSRDRKNIRGHIEKLKNDLLKSNLHFSRRALVEAERLTLEKESAAIDRDLASLERAAKAL